MSESAPLPPSNNQQDILAQYGLSSDPFGELPIPTVAVDDSYVSGFFMGAERRAVLDEVLHLCQFGNNLVALLGEVGVGKTALVHQAVLELHEAAKCCLVNASSMATMADIFSQVVSSLGIDLSADATAGEMLAAVRQHTPIGQHQRMVIIIDDANYLDDQILAAIVSLLQGQQSYHLHVLLVGDNSLASRLDKFEMVDVLIYDIALRAFRADEIEQYLQFKLDLAGYQGDRLFSEADITELWQETRGLPVAINNAARASLLQPSPSDDAIPASFSLPIGHMVIIGVLLVALIMALFYMGDSPEERASEGDVTVPHDVVGAQGIEPTVADSPLVTDTSGQPQLPQDSTASPVVSISANDQLENKSQLDKAPSVVVEPPAVTVPVEPISTPEPVIAPKKEVDKTPTPAPTAVDVGFNSDERQVIAWPATNYTLQVMAAGQLKGVQAFVKRQPNRDDLRIVRVLRQSKPWYIVLVGVYSDSSEARLAIQSLPQSQVNSGPWPRKVSDIQQDIRQFRRK